MNIAILVGLLLMLVFLVAFASCDIDRMSKP